MSAPYLFVGLPLVLAPALYWLRGRTAGTAWPRLDLASAAVAALVLAVLAVALPLDQPIGLLLGLRVNSSATVLGRTFAMEASNRLGVAFVFLQAALLFALAWLVQPGRFFVTGGLGALGLLAAALFVQPFLFAALFIELAVAFTVFMLADERRPVTRGALRYLIYLSLGMPFVLITGWLLEGTTASPGDIAFTTQATVMLAIGFGALLAVAPLHSWLPRVAEEAPPLAAAFVFTVMRFVPVFLLLKFMDTYDWLGQNEQVYRALTVAGGALTLVGAGFAFGQQNLGRVAGYAVMIDTGAVLLAVGLGTGAGLQVALGTLVLSGLALPLWAVGLEALRASAGGDDFASLTGSAYSHPFASAALIFGLLSLAGFPVMAGFAGRWALLSLLAQLHPSAALALWLGTISVFVVCARGLGALLSPAGRGAPWAEDRLAVGVYAAGALLILLLGFFPQWLLPLVGSAAGAFTQLGR